MLSYLESKKEDKKRVIDLCFRALERITILSLPHFLQTNVILSVQKLNFTFDRLKRSPNRSSNFLIYILCCFETVTFIIGSSVKGIPDPGGHCILNSECDPINISLFVPRCICNLLILWISYSVSIY